VILLCRRELRDERYHNGSIVRVLLAAQDKPQNMLRFLRAVIPLVVLVLTMAFPFFACDGTEYVLIFRNESSNIGDACIYQFDPSMDVQDVMSVAWFVKGAAPTTSLRFRWTIDYCFVWSEIGRLAPGVVFEATQIWDASLETTNRILFKMTHRDTYTFADQQPGPEEGNLYILGDATLLPNSPVVGIGMAGAAIYVAPARPEVAWIYTPHPVYWITFGDYESGEILDVESISYKERVDFPPGTYSMTAIFNWDNTWTILPSSEADGH